MSKSSKLANPSISNVFEYDDTFPVQFCPICGSEHLVSGGREQPLLNCKESWLIRCNTCNWEMEVFIIKKGRKKFKFRQDSVNCKRCKDFYDYRPKRSLTDRLKKLADIIARNTDDWILPPDYDYTRLQCGWEDDCKEADCHKCSKKYKITLELTEAEVCAVEDCAIVDLPQHKKEKPRVYELTQEIMEDLSRKIFKELGKWNKKNILK